MSDRKIEAEIRTRRPATVREGPGEDPEAFRAVMAGWVTGVTIVAVRDADDGQIHATTVSSLASVSADPPRIVISLGAGAQALPFLEPPGGSDAGRTGNPEGTRFAVSVLSEGQAGLARRYADSYPVGPSPFPEEGDPVVDGAAGVMVCEVTAMVPVGNCRLVVALVREAHVSEGAGGRIPPLLHYDREYHSLP